MPEDQNIKVDIKKQPYKENKYGRPMEDYPDVLTEKLGVKVTSSFIDFVAAPGKWFNDLCQKTKSRHIYYHEKISRVPTVDECYTDDFVCIAEADEQFKRDKKVDAAILRIILKRLEQCLYYHTAEYSHLCKEADEDYRKYKTIFHLKYDDMPAFSKSVDMYMKQKHRLILKRREEEKKENLNKKL